MTADLKQEFWDRLSDINSGMLGTAEARAVPMSHYVDRDTGSTLWFITAKNTDLAKSAASPAAAQYIVSSSDEALYARIDGTLSQSHDRAELDKLWNAVADAWFEDGKTDDDVQLLRLDLSTAEVWITGGSLKFFYEMAKAQISDQKPDIGDHAMLTF